MRLLDDIARMIRDNPNRLPQLSASGTSWRDIVQIGERRPEMLADYLRAAAKATQDEAWLLEQTQRILRKDEIKNHPDGCEALLRVLEERRPQQAGKQIALLYFDCLRSLEQGRHEATLNMLIERFDVARRDDLATAQGDTWTGMEAFCQHLRNQGMLLRFNGTQETVCRLRQIGVLVLSKLRNAGGDMEADNVLNILGDPKIFHGLLHRACHDHDKNPDNGLTINVLIDSGADWEKVITQELASDSAKQIIYDHPAVKRAQLALLAANRGGMSGTAPKI